MAKVEWYADFVDEGHSPLKDDIVALFYFEPAAGISKKEAVGRKKCILSLRAKRFNRNHLRCIFSREIPCNDPYHKGEEKAESRKLHAD